MLCEGLFAPIVPHSPHHKVLRGSPDPATDRRSPLRNATGHQLTRKLAKFEDLEAFNRTIVRGQEACVRHEFYKIAFPNYLVEIRNRAEKSGDQHDQHDQLASNHCFSWVKSCCSCYSSKFAGATSFPLRSLASH